MSTAAALALAMLIDAALGEPSWIWNRLPHPAVVMGRCVAWCDRQLNHGAHRRAKGVLALGILVGAAAVLGSVIQMLPFAPWIEALIAAVLLAQRSLVQHVRAVSRGLRVSIGNGRRAVAMIVGRDTQDMTPPEVSRAAIESAAENLSDGVVAPALWFLIGGAPGILVYKITNTADSVIGYCTPQYEKFGWAAARFDDLLNWVPARITALLILLAGGHPPHRSHLRTDATQHRSPNAGWPEAAMARVLDVALSGPRAYHGQRQEFPFVHPAGRRDAGPGDIDAAARTLWRVWGLMLAVVMAFMVF